MERRKHEVYTRLGCSAYDFWALKKQQTGFLQGKEDHTNNAFCLSSCKMGKRDSPRAGSQKQEPLATLPLPHVSPAHLPYPHSAFILAQPSYDKRRMPCRVNSVGLSMYPYTFSVSVQCSMTTRWDGRGYPNSCCLSWKFQALSTICLYIHRCIEEPSIRLQHAAASPSGLLPF